MFICIWKYADAGLKVRERGYYAVWGQGGPWWWLWSMAFGSRAVKVAVGGSRVRLG